MSLLSGKRSSQEKHKKKETSKLTEMCFIYTVFCLKPDISTNTTVQKFPHNVSVDALSSSPPQTSWNVCIQPVSELHPWIIFGLQPAGISVNAFLSVFSRWWGPTQIFIRSPITAPNVLRHMHTKTPCLSWKALNVYIPKNPSTACFKCLANFCLKPYVRLICARRHSCFSEPVCVAGNIFVRSHFRAANAKRHLLSQSFLNALAAWKHSHPLWKQIAFFKT